MENYAKYLILWRFFLKQTSTRRLKSRLNMSLELTLRPASHAGYLPASKASEIKALSHISTVKVCGWPTHSERTQDVRCPENIDFVRDSVVRSPKKALGLRSQEFGISLESVRIILIHNVILYPYRIQIKHKLTASHMQKRVTMCWWFSDKI